MKTSSALGYGEAEPLMTDTADVYDCLAAWHSRVCRLRFGPTPLPLNGAGLFSRGLSPPLVLWNQSSRGKVGTVERKLQVFQLTSVALPCLSSAAGSHAGVKSPGRGRACTPPSAAGRQRLVPDSDSRAYGMTEGTEKLNCINLSNLRFKRPHPAGHVSCRQISVCRLLIQ